MNLTLMVFENSPLLAKVDVHKYGSNKLRTKLFYIHDLELTKSRLQEPIIKGRGYKSRTAINSKQKEKEKNSDRGKLRKASAVLEPAYD